jgi:hypothetical protein
MKTSNFALSSIAVAVAITGPCMVKAAPGDLDTERALRDFFYSRSDASLFELSSVRCSGEECALRVVAFGNGRMSGQGGFDSGPIQTIAYEYSKSELSKTLLPDGLRSNYFEDRTVYTLAFKRTEQE